MDARQAELERFKAELGSTRQQTDEAVRQRSERVAELDAKIAELNKEAEGRKLAIDEDMDARQAELERFKTELGSTQQQTDKAVRQRSERVAELDAKIVEINKKAEERERAIDKEIEAEQAELERLRAELVNTQQQTDEVVRQRSERAAELDAKIAELNKEAEGRKRVIYEEIKAKQAEFEQLGRELDNTQQQADERFRERVQEMGELDTKIAALNKEAEERKHVIDEEIDAKQAELERLKTELGSTQQQADEAIQQRAEKVTALENRIAELNKEAEERRRAIDEEIEAEQAELERLRAELVSTQQQADETVRQRAEKVTELENKIAELNKEAEERKRAMDEEIKGKQAELEQIVEELGNRIAALNKEAEERKFAVDEEIKAKQSELERLKTELGSTQQQTDEAIRQREEKVDELDAKIAELNKEAEERKLAIDEEIGAKQAELEQIVEELESAKSQIAITEQQKNIKIEELEVKIQQAERKLESLTRNAEEEIKQSKLRKQVMAEEEQGLKETLEKLQKEIQKARLSAQEAEKDQKEAEIRSQAAEESMRVAAEKQQNAETMRGKLEKQIVQLKENAEQLKLQARKAQEKSEELEKMATKRAGDLIAEAEKNCEEILEKARKDAEQFKMNAISEGEKRASETLSQARARADNLDKMAEQGKEKILRKAEEEAKELMDKSVLEAKEKADQVLAKTNLAVEQIRETAEEGKRDITREAEKRAEMLKQEALENAQGEAALIIRQAQQEVKEITEGAIREKDEILARVEESVRFMEQRASEAEKRAIEAEKTLQITETRRGELEKVLAKLNYEVSTAKTDLEKANQAARKAEERMQIADARREELEELATKLQEDVKRAETEAQGIIKDAEAQRKELLEQAQKEVQKLAGETQDKPPVHTMSALEAMERKELSDYDWLFWEFFPETPYTKTGLTGLIDRYVRGGMASGRKTVYLEVGGSKTATKVSNKYMDSLVSTFTFGEKTSDINELSEEIRFLGKSEENNQEQLLDVITHLGSLEDIDDPAQVIASLYNNLRVEGILIAGYTIPEKSYESIESFIKFLKSFSELFLEYAQYKVIHLKQEGLYLITIIAVRESKAAINLSTQPIRPPKSGLRQQVSSITGKEFNRGNLNSLGSGIRKVAPLLLLIFALTIGIVPQTFAADQIAGAVNISKDTGAFEIIPIIISIAIAMVGMVVLASGNNSSEEKEELEKVLEDILPIAQNLVVGNAKAETELEKRQNLAAAVKEAEIHVPEQVEDDILEFVQRASQRDYKVGDEVLAQALRIMQLVYLSRNPVETDLNLVRYAWAGKTNQVMYDLDDPSPGENDVAEVWHGSTVIKKGKEDNPSRIKGTAITVGNVTLPEIHLRGLMEASPGVLGGEHKEKPFFIKFLCTRFADKVHMGFNSKMKSVSRDEFIEWLIRERANAERIKSALKEGISREEFEEYLKLYEEWALLQADSKWLISRKDPRVRAIVEKMKPYFKPSTDVHEIFGDTSSTRINIVSVLNEIELKPGMTVLSPAGYPHAMFGLSHQTHPTRVITHEDGTKEYPKNEAWVVISVKDAQGKEHLISVEPQQTSNDTYSWGDFYTPIVWDAKAGAPIMRKNVTADDIRGFVESGLYTDRITRPEDFVIEPVDITPAKGAVNARLESLIEETSPVWKSKYFVTHRVTLGGKDDVNKASIKMTQVKDSYHELIVTKGKVTVKFEGKPDIGLGAGEYLFMPATLDEYTIESSDEAEVLKFFPADESYNDIEGKHSGEAEEAHVEEQSLKEEEAPAEKRSSRPLFELIETTINNRRTRLVNEANEVIEFLANYDERSFQGSLSSIDSDQNTAELISRMQGIVDEAERFQKSIAKNEESGIKQLPKNIISNIEDIKTNLDQLEFDSVVASIIILARAAERESRNIIIGLEADWIPGFEKGQLQRNAMNGHLKDIATLDRLLKSMGLKNVKLVYKRKKENLDSWVSKITGQLKDPQDLSNVIILGSEETINYVDSSLLNGVDNDKRAFLAGIDSSQLKKSYDENGENERAQLIIEIMKMLSITLELASGKQAPDLSIIKKGSYNKDLRKVIFLPEAKPIEYKDLLEVYRMKRLARQSV